MQKNIEQIRVHKRRSIKWTKMEENLVLKLRDFFITKLEVLPRAKPV